MSGHPFYLSTTPDGIHGGGTFYDNVIRTNDTLTISITDDTPDLYYFCELHSGMGGSTSIVHNYIDLPSKADTPGHKHKEDLVQGSYELRVDHTQRDGRRYRYRRCYGCTCVIERHKANLRQGTWLAADWNGDGLIDIDDVMGVLARSRGIHG